VDVSRADGQPVEDASATLRRPGDAEPDLVRWSEDRLTFSGVPAGRWRLTVGARGLPSWEDELTVERGAETLRVPVVLGGLETLAGRVVDDRGEGVPFASVQWWSGDGVDSGGVEAAEDGSFRFEGLPRGTYLVRAASKSGAWVPGVEVATPAKDVRLTLPRGGLVRLVLVAPDGRPLPEAIEVDGLAASRTDRGYVVPVLLPVGRRRLEVRDHGRPRAFLDFAVEVDVRPGATVTARSLVLDFGVRVTGTVFDPTGSPAPGVGVSVGNQFTRTDSHGGFSVPAVPRKVVTVSALGAEGMAATRVDAAEQTGDVELRLTAGRRVRIEVPEGADTQVRARPRGEAWDDSPLGDHPHVDSAVDGRGVSLLRLPPGAWTLVAVRGDGALRTMDVVVPAVGDEQVSVRFPPW
jgi:hypothetical protein